MSNVPVVLTLIAATSPLFGWWVLHRRNERLHQEEMSRQDHRRAELAMIKRAAFEQPEATELMVRLLAADRAANNSEVEAPEGNEAGLPYRGRRMRGPRPSRGKRLEAPGEHG